jgi:hypothetical protein
MKNRTVASVCLFMLISFIGHAVEPVKPKAPPVASSIQLGLTLADDIILKSGPLPTDLETGKLFKNLIVKILKISPDTKMLQVESELGKGWIEANKITRQFDRSAALRTYEVQTGMAWFFDRFNQGTNYETMSFENEEFSVDEYRSLLYEAEAGKDEEQRAAQIVLSRSLLSRIHAGSKTPQDLYFAKKINDPKFWPSVHSKVRDFWSVMPLKFRSDREMILKIIPHGAYLIYDLLSATLKDDLEIAKITFAENPESFQYASDRLKDNEEVTLVAALANPLAVEHASSRLKDKEEIFKKIAPINAMSLQFASERLKKIPEFVTFICSYRPWALQYAAAEVLDNSSVFLSLAPKNPMVISLASARLKADAPFLQKMYNAASDEYKQPFYDSFPVSIRHQINPPQ